MKIYIFGLFLMISIHQAIAQEEKSNADKLSIWYRNSYQPVNQKQIMVTEEKMPVPEHKMKFNTGEDNFLYYSPYRLGVNSLATSNNNRGTVAYGSSYNYGIGYLPLSDPGYIGSYFLASGINYVIDKTIDRKKTKRK